MSGYGCDTPKKPTVFTRVSAYIDWMNSVSMKVMCMDQIHAIDTISLFHYPIEAIFATASDLIISAFFRSWAKRQRSLFNSTVSSTVLFHSMVKSNINKLD